MNTSQKKLIYISSVHAIPEKPIGQIISEVNEFNPDLVTGGYAKTKATASQLVVNSRKFGLNSIIIHPSGLIGPGDRNNGNIKQAIIDYINRKLFAMIPGGYDFVDVRDVTEAIIKLSANDSIVSDNFIISGNYWTVRQIIDTVDRLRPSSKHRLIMIPTWFMKIVASLSEQWYKLRRVAPTFTRYSLYTLTSNGSFSHQKATDKLNYQPRPIDETLRDTISWYESEGLIPPSR